MLAGFDVHPPLLRLGFVGFILTGIGPQQPDGEGREAARLTRFQRFRPLDDTGRRNSLGIVNPDARIQEHARVDPAPPVLRLR